MTLLTISQNIAKTTKTGEIPATIINNTQEIAQQLFESVRLATKDVFERHDWSVLNYDKTFNSVASQAQYDLPSDFDRMVDSTFFNTTRRTEIFLITPRAWRQFSLNVNASIIHKYRIRQNKVELLPTPSSVEAFVYEYISNLVILATDGITTKTDWTADSDTSLLNEDLIELQATWRFLKLRGKAYADEQREADDRLLDISGRDAGRAKIYPDYPNYRGNYRFMGEITP